MVYIASYLQNCLPSKAIEEDITPIKKWCGHKPYVSHMRMFGSIIYIHVPDQKKRKLDIKAKRGVFVGYSNQSKGYRVLILENEKIEVSRDVEFEESKKWDWKRQEEVRKTLELSM